jgi:hypothetical protein
MRIAIRADGNVQFTRTNIDSGRIRMQERQLIASSL